MRARAGGRTGTRTAARTLNSHSQHTRTQVASVHTHTHTQRHTHTARARSYTTALRLHHACAHAPHMSTLDTHGTPSAASPHLVPLGREWEVVPRSASEWAGRRLVPDYSAAPHLGRHALTRGLLPLDIPHARPATPGGRRAQRREEREPEPASAFPGDVNLRLSSSAFARFVGDFFADDLAGDLAGDFLGGDFAGGEDLAGDFVDLFGRDVASEAAAGEAALPFVFLPGLTIFLMAKARNALSSREATRRPQYTIGSSDTACKSPIVSGPVAGGALRWSKIVFSRFEWRLGGDFRFLNRHENTPGGPEAEEERGDSVTICLTHYRRTGASRVSRCSLSGSDYLSTGRTHGRSRCPGPYPQRHPLAPPRAGIIYRVRARPSSRGAPRGGGG